MAHQLKQLSKPYRDEQNRWLSRALFREWYDQMTINHRKFQPVFSLYRDYPGLINARTTFVELNDPTGYKWAIEYLGDFEHWTHLMERDWFQEAVAVWRNELNQKLKSEAIVKIRELSEAKGSQQALAAAKFLAELDRKNHGRGRPSKEEVSAEMKRLTKQASVEDEDFARIAEGSGLKMIQGGKT